MRKQLGTAATIALAVFISVLLSAWATTKIVSVAITGSTIDSTPIGSTAPSTGVFTNLYANTEGYMTALAVTNNATVGGTLGITGTTTVGGTLGITGTTTGAGASFSSITATGLGASASPVCTTTGGLLTNNTTTCGTAFTGTSGYQRLTSGLILEWGSVPDTGGSTYAVSFPLTFPTSLFNISVTSGPSDTVRDQTTIANTPVPTTSGFTAVTPGSTINFNWFAVGY